MGMYFPGQEQLSYQDALHEARRQNPARKKEDYIDVEFWDTPTINQQISFQGSDSGKDCKPTTTNGETNEKSTEERNAQEGRQTKDAP